MTATGLHLTPGGKARGAGVHRATDRKLPKVPRLRIGKSGHRAIGKSGHRRHRKRKTLPLMNTDDTDRKLPGMAESSRIGGSGLWVRREQGGESVLHGRAATVVLCLLQHDFAGLAK